MNRKIFNIIQLLTVLLTIALAVVSYIGAFIESTYVRDNPSMAAQGMGQDLVDLFLVVPVLIILYYLIRKDNIIPWLILSGVAFYIAYSFVIYAFGVHFNRLFLLYCLILGISLYLFIIVLYELNTGDIRQWFSGKVPARGIGIFFILVALVFYVFWFKDVLPAIWNDTIPKSVSDYDLLVNPVHVLDIAIALPGLIITAALLIRQHPMGYLLTPAYLIFIIILGVALIGMVLRVKAEGIEDEASIAFIFGFLAVISFIFLWIFLRKVKGEKQ